MYFTAADGLTRFVIQHGPGPHAVLLAGSFSHWRLIPMRRHQDGAFIATVRLPAGVHEYKFVVNGQWLIDPQNPEWCPNGIGSLNSVVKV